MQAPSIGTPALGRTARWPTLAALGAALWLALALNPTAAEAGSGLYLQLGLGYGSFSGTELVTQEVPGGKDGIGDYPDTDSATCCPGPGLATQFRLGWSLFGFGGPEFGLVANGWDLGNSAGGAGFIGGGIRLFPIKFLGLLGLDDKDFPLDAGIGVMFGYSLVGKDFAYTGTFWDVDLHVEYKLTSFLSAGVKFDAIFPKYGDFALTSYKNNRGRCLDSGANQDLVNQAVPIDRDAADCAGRGPETTYITPQIVFTFHFDPFDS
ncbi:MAG: hypothetical protein KC933_01780 [Myxococcales bacterium]|nr:hypothetical protein [Myxococcales bacterium]MCB9648440.1 hypothetical protein [Deltaproteobacteria bacterium]